MTILERFRVDGRVAIVTGASSGIGVAAPSRWRRPAPTWHSPPAGRIG